MTFHHKPLLRRFFFARRDSPLAGGYRHDFSSSPVGDDLMAPQVDRWLKATDRSASS